MRLAAAGNAAVIVSGHAPAMSVDLSRILRLSHAGTVRLVDRLVERNLVEKRPSALDRRMISLALTTDGWQQRYKLLALRRAALDGSAQSGGARRFGRTRTRRRNDRIRAARGRALRIYDMPVLR
jgi:DNA-binding MarR family transcriptional regulator